MHYFITKIPEKRELQQITFNHSSGTEFKDFTNFYKKSTAKSLASDNTLRFRKNLLERI